MPALDRQFHATPTEAIAFAVQAARDYGLTLVVEQFFPSYETNVVADLGGPLDRTRFAVVDRLALCIGDPDLSPARAHQFVESNPDCLVVLVGKVSNGGLRATAISGATNDLATLRTWRSMLRGLGASMHAGARVVNPVSGAEALVKPHRHSTGAHSLAQHGVPMLALAGWNEYLFDDIDRDPGDIAQR